MYVHLSRSKLLQSCELEVLIFHFFEQWKDTVDTCRLDLIKLLQKHGVPLDTNKIKELLIKSCELDDVQPAIEICQHTVSELSISMLMYGKIFCL